MCVVWTTTSFNFYLLYYLVNSFERVYQIALFISIADICAYITGSILVTKVSARQTLVFSFSLAALGGFLLLTYGLRHEDTTWFSLLFFVSRFGIASTFGTIYFGNKKIFPDDVAASSMGLIQVVARLFSALQFFFSQMEQPTPMLIFTISSTVTAILCLFLKEQDQRPSKNFD